MEKAIYPVCSTFTELLASLRDFEEEDWGTKNGLEF